MLGDRIRMQTHTLDPDVFIRSMATRGSLGGLARATGDVIKLLDAFGFSWIIIETVGVGQTELDIIRQADTTVVALVPESGDSIQAMKAGLMEVADVFVVNKADRPGAHALMAELRFSVHLHYTTRGASQGVDWEVPVLATEGANDVGIDELLEAIKRHRTTLSPDGRAGDASTRAAARRAARRSSSRSSRRRSRRACGPTRRWRARSIWWRRADSIRTRRWRRSSTARSGAGRLDISPGRHALSPRTVSSNGGLADVSLASLVRRRFPARLSSTR